MKPKLKNGIDTIRSRADTLNVRKQTKSENIFALILVIFDFDIQTDPEKQKTEETAAISKETSIVPDGDRSPNKRIPYEKCFVLPLINYMSRSKFQALNVFMN